MRNMQKNNNLSVSCKEFVKIKNTVPFTSNTLSCNLKHSKYLITNDAAHFIMIFFADSLSNRNGGNSPRLGDHNVAVLPLVVAVLEDPVRDLGSLATASWPFNYSYGALVNSAQDLDKI